ncbi:MAG: electron transfer flavoprotein subunit beta/FixA family protein, partial [Magnetococcus sp. YQC-3]
MNILVALKPVVDPTRPPAYFTERERAGWDAAGAATPESYPEKTLLNPFDEIALEAALRFQEAGLASRVTVVSVGPAEWEGFLRTALAMGAERALRVEAPPDLEPLAVAQALAAVAIAEQSDLLLTGRQAVDADHNQTGQMTAALLQWGQVTHAIQIALQAGAAEVLREGDRGLEHWSVPLPAVITVDWRLNGIHETGGPRYASLPNIMQARRKPLLLLSPDQLGVTFTRQITPIACLPPTPPPPPGRRVQRVNELLAALSSL